MSGEVQPEDKKPTKKTIIKYILIGVGIAYAILFTTGYVINHSHEWMPAANVVAQQGGLEENINFEGWVDIYHCGESGTVESDFCPDGQKLITELHGQNLIVERGHTCMADRIAGHSGIACSAMNYIALGVSTVDPADGDTALGSETCGGSYARLQDTDATYTDGSPDRYVISVSFTGFTCAVTEYGIFDAATTGNIMSHIEQALINLGSSDTLTVNWTINEA